MACRHPSNFCLCDLGTVILPPKASVSPSVNDNANRTLACCVIWAPLCMLWFLTKPVLPKAHTGGSGRRLLRAIQQPCPSPSMVVFGACRAQKQHRPTKPGNGPKQSHSLVTGTKCYLTPRVPQLSFKALWWLRFPPIWGTRGRPGYLVRLLPPNHLGPLCKGGQGGTAPDHM